MNPRTLQFASIPAAIEFLVNAAIAARPEVRGDVKAISRSTELLYQAARSAQGAGYSLTWGAIAAELPPGAPSEGLPSDSEVAAYHRYMDLQTHVATLAFWTAAHGFDLAAVQQLSNEERRELIETTNSRN